MRVMLEAAGLNPKVYVPHSFRMGATTDLVAVGATVEKVRVFGRWKMAAYMKYVKPNVIVV